MILRTKQIISSSKICQKVNLKAKIKSHRIISSVDVVSHEEIICIWRFSTDAEQLHQIMELTVNISTNGNRAADRLHI